MINNFYNYILLDPRKKGKFLYENLEFEFEPFYVGKGKCGRHKRHLLNVKYGNFKNSPKNQKINKLIKMGLEPLVIIIESDLCEEASFENEKYLINLIGRKDLNNGTLLNLTDGGEGPSGRVMTEIEKVNQSKRLKGVCYKERYGKNRSDEIKEKISKNQPYRKGVFGSFYGEHHSEETKQKLRLHNLGKKYSKKTLKKMSESHKGMVSGMKGKHHTEDSKEKNRLSHIGIKNKNSRRTIQMDLDGNFIKEWDHINSAAVTLGIHHSSIVRCCRGQRNKAGNYKWAYTP